MIDVTSKNLNIQLSEKEKITAHLSCCNLQVIFGRNAKMNAVQALNYIKSGAAEIASAVNEGIENFNDNAVAETATFNDNSAAKTVDFDNHAAQAIAEAEAWARQSAASASSMANRDLSNLTANGLAKFSAKQDVIGDLAAIRSGATLGATAVQPAALTLKAGVDLANLTAEGEAKFSAKQDAINDLAAIRSGAALGATAVQPADLNNKADVDLSNCTKPHIVETYQNGSYWYRKYSDGWIEQGGEWAESTDAAVVVYFMYQFNATPNIIMTRNILGDAANDTTPTQVRTNCIWWTSNLGFWTYGNAWAKSTVMWRACGY